MRILFLAPQPFYVERGTPIAVRLAVETLARAGNSIDLLVYHEGADVAIPNVRLIRAPKPPGVRNIPVGPSWKKIVCDVYFLWHFLDLALKQRYDVLHVVEESSIMAYATRWIHKTPYVVDMDSSLAGQLVETFPWLGGFARLFGSIENAALRKAVAVLAVCRELAEHARRAGVRAPISVLEDVAMEGPTERPPGARSLREDLRILPSVPIVLYVGNFQKYQGVQLLLEAFARTKHAGALVVVGGNSVQIAAARETAKLLGLEGKAHFPGPRPLEQLSWIMAQAQVLASPRLTGVNTPMKVYSYLLSGVPMAATRIPSHTQVLDDTVASLAPPEPQAFADAIDRLLGDPALRDTLGRAARERAQQEYSRTAFDRKLLSFYQTVQTRVLAMRTQEQRAGIPG